MDSNVNQSQAISLYLLCTAESLSFNEKIIQLNKQIIVLLTNMRDTIVRLLDISKEARNINGRRVDKVLRRISIRGNRLSGGLEVLLTICRLAYRH